MINSRIIIVVAILLIILFLSFSDGHFATEARYLLRTLLRVLH